MSFNGTSYEGYDQFGVYQGALALRDFSTLVVGPGVGATPPNSTTIDNIVTWNNNTGTLVKDSGIPITAIGGGGSANKIATYTLTDSRFVASNTVYEMISQFPWSVSEHGAYTNGKVNVRVTTGNRAIDIRLQDVTNGITLGTLTVPVSSNGTFSFSVTNATTNAELQLQIRRSTSGGTAPTVRGAVVQYSITTSRAFYTLTDSRFVTNSVVYTPIGEFPWSSTDHNSYSNGTVIVRVITSNRSVDIRLQDVTNNVTLGTLTVPVSSNGTFSFSVTNATTNAELQLQIRKSVSGGISPSVRGAVIQYTV